MEKVDKLDLTILVLLFYKKTYCLPNDNPENAEASSD